MALVLQSEGLKWPARYHLGREVQQIIEGAMTSCYDCAGRDVQHAIYIIASTQQGRNTKESLTEFDAITELESVHLPISPYGATTPGQAFSNKTDLQCRQRLETLPTRDEA